MTVAFLETFPSIIQFEEEEEEEDDNEKLQDQKGNCMLFPITFLVESQLTVAVISYMYFTQFRSATF